jgi:hypothetical protein
MKWAAMLLATAQLGAAQTYTDCDPLNSMHLLKLSAQLEF